MGVWGITAVNVPHGCLMWSLSLADINAFGSPKNYLFFQKSCDEDMASEEGQGSAPTTGRLSVVSSTSASSSSPSFVLLLLFLFRPFPLHGSVSACFPAAPGSGCCSAPSCAASVPRCSSASLSASHLSSYSHVAPAPPAPFYGQEELYHPHHHGEDDYGGYDKHGHGESYGDGKGYGSTWYGDTKYGGGGHDSRKYNDNKYEHYNGNSGRGYGDTGQEKGYVGRGEYDSKGYGNNAYERGYSDGHSGNGHYSGTGYADEMSGDNPPAMYAQFPTYPISSSYIVVPPPAYPEIFNNLYAFPSSSLSHPPYAQLSLATPVQSPAVQPYQQTVGSSSNSLPAYVQQQSLYGSPYVSPPSPSHSADLYQPNVRLPQQQYTVEQPIQLPSSPAVPLPYAVTVPPSSAPPIGPFVMTFAEPLGAVPFAQSPAGGYGKAKVKSTKMLSTLVEKAKSNKDKVEKDSRKSE